MADAQATFTITLDPSGLQSGAAAGASALDKLRGRIQQQQKSLDALRGSMARLKGSAAVMRFDAITKAGGELDKATAAAAKLASKLQPLRENIEIGKQANLRPEDMQKLVDAAKPLEDAFAAASEKVAQLQGDLAELNQDSTVQAFQDQERRAKELEGSLADLQTQFDRAGGDATTLKDAVDQPTGSLQKLTDAASEGGAPLSGLVQRFQQLRAAGPAAVAAAVAMAIIAVAKAAIQAAVNLAKFIATAATLGHMARVARGAAAFGTSAGTADIEGTMGKLRANTALARDEAQKLASELYRAGERGKGLEDTALTIARFGVLGEDASSAVKGLYEELRKPAPMLGGVANNSMVITKDTLPRDVFLELANQLGKDGNKALLQGFTANRDDIRGALSRIGEQRFAGPALEQMRSLEKLSERLHENLQDLFGGLKVGSLLAAAQKLVMLLDASSESGKGLRKIAETIFQPIANFIDANAPLVEALFEGMVFGALVVTLAVLKLKNAFEGAFGGKLTKNIDWVNVAFGAGAAIVGALALAFVVLAGAVTLVALPFIAVGRALFAALDALAGWADEAESTLNGVDFSAAVSNIIDGIVKGFVDGAGRVVDAVKDLGAKALKAFEDFNIIKSPSRLWRMTARWIPAGAADGIEDGTREVQQAAADMVSPEVMAGGAGGAMGARGSVQVTMQPGAITITGVRDAEQMTTPAFERLLARVFTQWAASGGVPVAAEAT